MFSKRFARSCLVPTRTFARTSSYAFAFTSVSIHFPLGLVHLLPLGCLHGRGSQLHYRQFDSSRGVLEAQYLPPTAGSPSVAFLLALRLNECKASLPLVFLHAVEYQGFLYSCCVFLMVLIHGRQVD